MAEGDRKVTINDEKGYPCPYDGTVLDVFDKGAWCSE